MAAGSLLAHAAGGSVRVLSGSADDSLGTLAAFRPDLLVVNPPRKGLGEELCRHLAGSGIPRLLYLSCGPNSLARDLAVLQPAYRIGSLDAWDMIPNSPHVESLVVLERL
jgi:23S rRNA (uracil747-C5)-methyltransferase